MYQPTLYLLDFWMVCGLRMLSAMTGWYIAMEQAVATEAPAYVPLKTLTNNWTGRKLDLTGFDGTIG